MQNPCVKECLERSITCHSHCKRYFEWLAEESEKKHLIRKTKEKEYMDYKSAVIQKTTRKKRGQI